MAHVSDGVRQASPLLRGDVSNLWKPLMRQKPSGSIPFSQPAGAQGSKPIGFRWAAETCNRVEVVADISEQQQLVGTAGYTSKRGACRTKLRGYTSHCAADFRKTGISDEQQHPLRDTFRCALAIAIQDRGYCARLCNCTRTKYVNR